MDQQQTVLCKGSMTNTHYTTPVTIQSLFQDESRWTILMVVLSSIES